MRAILTVAGWLFLLIAILDAALWCLGATAPSWSWADKSLLVYLTARLNFADAEEWRP